MNKNRNSVLHLSLLVRITLVFANIAIFLGIVVAIFNYYQMKHMEERKNAIDAVNRFYNSDFLKSTAIIKSNIDHDSNEYIGANNLVFNTYYIISIIYQNNIADNEIIQKAIKNELEDFTKTEEFNKEPEGVEKQSILLMLSNINLKKQSK